MSRLASTRTAAILLCFVSIATNSRGAVRIPPHVKIVSPSSSGSCDAVVQSVVVEVAGYDDERTVVRVRQNGVRVAPLDSSEEIGPSARRFTFQLRLVRGKNDIVAEAANQDVESASRALVTLDYTPPLRPKKTHLIAVGVSKYQDRSLSLQYAANDAAAVRDALKDCRKDLGDEVASRLLLDEQAMRDDINLAVQRAADACHPEDLLVVYWSGFGYTSANGTSYLLPFDCAREAGGEGFESTGLRVDELINAMATSRSKNLLLIVDSDISLPGEVGGEAVKALTSNGVLVLKNSAATNYEFGELKHSVMTYLLLAALGAVDHGPLGESPISSNEPASVWQVLDYVERHAERAFPDDFFSDSHASRGKPFPRFSVSPE